MCHRLGMRNGQVIGWGYQGRTSQDLAADLHDWDIDALIDVRLTPVSRKQGFSKSRLGELCGEVGVEYVHVPQLGNPKDNRAGFAVPSQPAGARAHTRFDREVLETDDGQRALHDLAVRRDAGQRLLLLCFEADERCCHRSLVLRALRQTRSVAA